MDNNLEKQYMYRLLGYLYKVIVIIEEFDF